MEGNLHNSDGETKNDVIRRVLNSNFKSPLPFGMVDVEVIVGTATMDDAQGNPRVVNYVDTMRVPAQKPKGEN